MLYKKLSLACCLVIATTALFSTGCLNPAHGPDLGLFAIPIPVSPYFQKRLEDEAYEHERYQRVPVMGPITAGVEIKALDPSQRERVVALQKRQKLLGSNLAPIVSRLNGMVQEIANNRLEEEDGVLKARLSEKVIAPLASLLEGAMPAAAVGLDSVRRVADLEQRNASFVSVEAAQRDVIAIMREVLVHMVRNEGYQQAVNLLYEIQRAQERMQLMTKKAKEESLKKVLRDKNDPDPKGESSRDEPPGSNR